MTGKQFWERLIELDDAVGREVAAASDDDLRHALGYALNRGDDQRTARLRATIRRTLSRRGAKIPPALEPRA